MGNGIMKRNNIGWHSIMFLNNEDLTPLDTTLDAVPQEMLALLPPQTIAPAGQVQTFVQRVRSLKEIHDKEIWDVSLTNVYLLSRL
jgi:hypothetical protein